MAWTFSGFAGPLEQDGRGWYWRKPLFTNDDPVGERCVPLKFREPPGAARLTEIIQRLLDHLNEPPPTPPHAVLRERIRAVIVAHWAYINNRPALRDAIMATLEDIY